jgi:hypothetical protein
VCGSCLGLGKPVVEAGAAFVFEGEAGAEVGAPLIFRTMNGVTATVRAARMGSVNLVTIHANAKLLSLGLRPLTSM